MAFICIKKNYKLPYIEVMRYFQIVLLLTLSTVFVTQAYGNPWRDRIVLQALQDTRDNNTPNSLPVLEFELATRSHDEIWYEGQFIVAQAFLQQGELNKALSFIRNAETGLNEVQDYVQDKKAQILRRLHRWEDALSAWQKALHLYPNSPLAPRIICSIGDAYYALNQYPEAIRYYHRAIRLTSHHYFAQWARFNLGHIYEHMHNLKVAIPYYKSVLSKFPTSPVADLARQHLTRISEQLNRPLFTFYEKLELVDHLLNKGKTQEAANILERVNTQELSRARRLAWHQRQAILFYKMRDFDSAQKIFSELHRSSRGRQRIHYLFWIARSYSASDQNEQAIETYLKIFKKYERKREGIEALFKAAWFSYNQRDYARANQLFGQFIKRYPRDSGAAEALWYLAWIAYRSDDLWTASAVLKRLAESYPNSADFNRSLYWRAKLLSLSGQSDEALQLYFSLLDTSRIDYYSFLALQRINELKIEQHPIVKNKGPFVLAELASDSPTHVASDAITNYGPRADFTPGANELPLTNAFKPLPTVSIPWGGSVIDWTSDQAKRALKLIKLGYNREAAQIIKELETLEGHSQDTVAYARARLLFSLGDYASAYKIAFFNFYQKIQGLPSPLTQAFFKLVYPVAFQTLIQTYSRKYNISPFLILAIMRQESAFKHHALSQANAKGLMQIIPTTGRKIAETLEHVDFDPGILNQPKTSIKFGAWYLSQLLNKFYGNNVLAICGYNAGPLAVTKWLERSEHIQLDEFIEEIPYRETRTYIKRVLANLGMYKLIYSNDPFLIHNEFPKQYRDYPDF